MHRSGTRPYELEKNFEGISVNMETQSNQRVPNINAVAKTENGEIDAKKELQVNTSDVAYENEDEQVSTTNISNADEANQSATSESKTNALNNEGDKSLENQRHICLKDYVMIDLIGTGSFSVIHKAINLRTEKKVAIKAQEKRKVSWWRRNDKAYCERHIMLLLDQVPGFVQLEGTYKDEYTLYFVMTYAPNSDLHTYIIKLGCFDPDCARHYAAELLLACEQMHRRNIIHCDLKPENMLMDENMHTLICDFGNAEVIPRDVDKYRTIAEYVQFLSNEAKNDGESSSDESGYDLEQTKKSFMGTPYFSAPEQLANGYRTPAVDLWALGCIIYQMLAGRMAFYDKSLIKVYERVHDGDVAYPEGFDESARDLVQRLLQLKPEARLGAHDVIGHYESIRQHDFFRGVDFEQLHQTAPPEMRAYLPGIIRDVNLLVPEQMPASILEINFKPTLSQKSQLLYKQREHEYHCVAYEEVILKVGAVIRYNGLYRSDETLLLTTGPQLLFVDANEYRLVREIECTSELKADVINSRVFCIDMPEQNCYVESKENAAVDWVLAIRRMVSLINATET